MKKIYLLFLVLLISFTMFASQEMVMDVINHWNDKGVAYQRGEKYLSVSLTNHMQFWVEKSTDSILLVLDLNETTKADYGTFFVSNLIPFSSSVRQDILEILLDGFNYITTMQKLPAAKVYTLGDTFEYVVIVKYMYEEGYFFMILE